MGTMAKTVFETLVDRLGSRMDAAVVDTAVQMLTGNTEEGLATYIDDTVVADPELQAYLTASAVNVDRQMLRGNEFAYMNAAIRDTKWLALISAMNGWVRSTAGGSYADFPTYLNSVGATVSPLIAELIMMALGTTAFTYSSAIVGAMHPYMDTVAFDAVFAGTPGILDDLTDLTSEAASVAVGDVPIMTANGDILAVGSRSKFNYILTDVSTVASADCTITIKYWNGNAWTAVSGSTDSTTGFSVNDGFITWTMPTDWVPSDFDSQSPPIKLQDDTEQELYYIIIERTAAVCAPDTPVLTWLQTVPEAVTVANGQLWGGCTQPPLALVHITGVDTCTTIPLEAAEHARFVTPGTGNNELKLKAISAWAANNITYTMQYVDQDGNTAQTQSQGAWTAAIAAGDTHNGAIDGADTGIRSVGDGGTIVTNNTTGVFAIVVNAYSRALGAK